MAIAGESALGVGPSEWGQRGHVVRPSFLRSEVIGRWSRQSRRRVNAMKSEHVGLNSIRLSFALGTGHGALLSAV